MTKFWVVRTINQTIIPMDDNATELDAKTIASQHDLEMLTNITRSGHNRIILQHDINDYDVKAFDDREDAIKEMQRERKIKLGK